MTWSKAEATKFWPLTESLYGGPGSSVRVGQLFIRKSAFEKTERGLERFLAIGFVRLVDAGPHLLQVGSAPENKVLISPWTVENGIPKIGVRVEHALGGLWRWHCVTTEDVVVVNRFKEARWVLV